MEILPTDFSFVFDHQGKTAIQAKRGSDLSFYIWSLVLSAGVEYITGFIQVLSETRD